MQLFVPNLCNAFLLQDGILVLIICMLKIKGFIESIYNYIIVELPDTSDIFNFSWKLNKIGKCPE